MKEIYKDIPNYEGKYQVSNLGNVKSLSRIILKKGKYPFMSKEKILKQHHNGDGYLYVGLSKDGKNKVQKVHMLVAKTFLNHKPKGRELHVNHIDFDTLNNRLNNLEIVKARVNLNKKHLKSSSKYVGVCYRKDCKKWGASIHINKKRYHLGVYKNEYDAHLAYQNKLKTI